MKAPIPDPFLPPEVSADTRYFAHRFWRVYFGMIPMSVAFGLFFLTRGSTRLSPSLMGYVGFFLVFINPLISALVLMLRPVQVTKEGVQGHANIGFVGWERMRRVRFFWLGMPYVRVSVHKTPILALWIPLSMIDSQGFAQTIREWAPEGNPLRKWIEKRGFGA